MYRTVTQLLGITVTITAHRDLDGPILLIEVKTSTADDVRPRQPLDLSLVLDRSGSMGGRPIQIAREAIARLIESLLPEDRVSVVAFDGRVTISPSAPPSAALAARVRQIEARGSTNLYGGWLAGVKSVGEGGRVILLSDGQANAGRFSEAPALAAQAELSYREFLTTTSTIGIGEGYDEAVMAGMAHLGGGAHYFAHEVDAVDAALRNERFAAEQSAVDQVSLHIGVLITRFDTFWADETKARVLETAELPRPGTVTLHWRDRMTGDLFSAEVMVPDEFGDDALAGRERWLHQLSVLESEVVKLTSADAAGAMRERLIGLRDRLSRYPEATDTEAVLTRIDASIGRLDILQRNWSEDGAALQRKMSMQNAHNLRERDKAFSSFEDDQVLMQKMAGRGKTVDPQDLKFDPAALALAPRTRWEGWAALPIRVTPGRVKVAMTDPRDGICIEEMAKQTGCRIQAFFAGVDPAELQRLIQKN